MTIGIDARFFGPKGKGIGRYIQRLIGNLELLDSENEYVIFLRRENLGEFQPKNSRFRKVLADWRWYSVAEQVFLPFKIYQQKVDLMHFPHFNVPIFYFGPYVVTIHDLILQHFSTRRASTLGPLSYWFKYLAYKIVIWLALKRAKKIITVSQYVKNDIIKCFRIRPEKMIVTYEGVPNPAVIAIRQQAEKQSRPITIAHGIAASSRRGGTPRNDTTINYGIKKPYLLYVGNAYPHKNLERLIEAFEILVRDYKKDLNLVLVGEEDYFYQRLKREKIIKEVIFAGFVPDDNLPAFYRAAALYVFPSLCEGFGLPPLEAMSYGLPVVASGATCLPEILGEAAVYFNPLDPADMAEKINQVLMGENLRENLIVKGFEQIKKYSWRRMGEETLGIYLNTKI